MNVSKELLQSCAALLNKVFEFEGDVFGVQHNHATDVLSELEQLIKDNKHE